MAGIKVVVALVRCAADLLLCDDVDTDHLRFADAEECRNKLPAIISEHRRAGAPDQMVMGRCRFMADRTPTATAAPIHRGRHDAGIDVAGNPGSIGPQTP
jgi:hypothetical protein